MKPLCSWLRGPRGGKSPARVGPAWFARMLRCAAAVLAASGGLTWGSPAAAVPGLVLVQSAQTASNSVSPKTASVSCSTPGHKIFAVGGQITHAGASSGQVYIDQSYPNSTLTTAVTRAVEDAAGFAGNWSLTAFAVCGDATGLNLRRVKGTTAVSVSQRKDIFVPCAQNEKVYGSGFALHDHAIGRIFPSYAVLNVEALPFSPPGLQARASTDTDLSTAWDLDAFAICGQAAPGYTVIEEQPTEGDSTSPKSATLVCPSGKKLHGFGWVRAPATVIDRDLVTEDLDISPFGITVKVVENDPTPEIWEIWLTLICAN